MMQLDFDFADVNDEVGQRMQEEVLRIAGEHGVVTSDDVAHLSTGQRSRAVIGGVFAGLVKAGMLRVLPERIVSKQEQAHYRKIQQYTLVNRNQERPETEAERGKKPRISLEGYHVQHEHEIVPCGATSEVCC